MAKTSLDSLSAALAVTLAGGEPVYLVLFGSEGGNVEKPMYAINLKGCAQPAQSGRVKFNVPALEVQGAATFTSARFARKDHNGAFVDLGPLEGITFPVAVTNGNLNIVDLHVTLL